MRAGERVLDVAAGNGNASLAAARRFTTLEHRDQFVRVAVGAAVLAGGLATQPHHRIQGGGYRCRKHPDGDSVSAISALPFISCSGLDTDVTAQRVLAPSACAFAYRRIRIFLVRDGHKIGLERTHRRWRQAQLQVSRKEATGTGGRCGRISRDGRQNA